MLAIISRALAWLAPVLGSFLDKTFDAVTALVPVVVRNASRFARVGVWSFGVLFVLNLSSSLLAFTFYHLAMVVVIALSNYCTIFTVTMVLVAIELYIVLDLPFWFSFVTAAFGEAVVLVVSAPLMKYMNKIIGFAEKMA